jgi:hypothetical protein
MGAPADGRKRRVPGMPITWEVEQFPVPPGWRAPIMLHTLSRVDLRFRRAILAIIACLLLPKYFAAMRSTSSHLGRPDTCSRLLRILGPEQADALLARAEMATLLPNAHDASQVRPPSSPYDRPPTPQCLSTD